MAEGKLTGGLTNYYLVDVKHPQRTKQPPYQAECEDIAEALQLTPNEFCEFKAIWRTAAARLGNGYNLARLTREIKIGRSRSARRAVRRKLCSAQKQSATRLNGACAKLSQLPSVRARAA